MWTTKEIANELSMSRQFVIDSITGRSPYKLVAQKFGSVWCISDTDAKAFIHLVKNLYVDSYTPQQIADEIGKSRKYVLDALTGYGGKKPPRLKGEKHGKHWLIQKDEAQSFINEHLN